jgi:hypothetical protein
MKWPPLASRFHKRRIAGGLLNPLAGKAHHHYEAARRKKHRWQLDRTKQGESIFKRAFLAAPAQHSVFDLAARARTTFEKAPDHVRRAGSRRTRRRW